MANFLGCGFARVAVKLSILKANGKVEYDHEQRWKKYSEIFQGVHKSRFEVDKNVYTKRSKALEHHFKRWKTTTKKTYIEHFSQTNWEKLTEHEKKQHSLANCKACDVHHFSYQSLLPLCDNKTNTITHEGIYKQINSRNLKQSSAGNAQVKKKLSQVPQKRCMTKLIQLLQRNLESFAIAQTSVPELNVQVKKSRAELKKERRNQSRACKKHIEQQWTENACDTMLATRQTYNQRMSSGCFFALKLQRRRRPGQRNVNFWKNKASARGKGTLPTQRILNLMKMSSCKK